jgi:hypothetical protein
MCLSNSIYPQGYAYRGRIIGDSMDNDSRMLTLAGLLTLAMAISQPRRAPGGDQSRWWTHAISDVPLDVDNVELRYSRGWAGKLSVGSVTRPGDPAGSVLPRSRFRELATRILMLRAFVSAACC